MTRRIGTLKTRGRKAPGNDRPTPAEIRLVEEILLEISVPIGLDDLAKAAQINRRAVAAACDKLDRMGRVRKLYVRGVSGTHYLATVHG